MTRRTTHLKLSISLVAIARVALAGVGVLVDRKTLLILNLATVAGVVVVVVTLAPSSPGVGLGPSTTAASPSAGRSTGAVVAARTLARRMAGTTVARRAGRGAATIAAARRRGRGAAGAGAATIAAAGRRARRARRRAATTGRGGRGAGRGGAAATPGARARRARRARGASATVATAVGVVAAAIAVAASRVELGVSSQILAGVSVDFTALVELVFASLSTGLGALVSGVGRALVGVVVNVHLQGLAVSTVNIIASDNGQRNTTNGVSRAKVTGAVARLLADVGRSRVARVAG